MSEMNVSRINMISCEGAQKQISLYIALDLRLTQISF